MNEFISIYIMEANLTVISVREYDSSKFVKQSHRKYLGVDVRGVSVLVLAIDNDDQKVSFFSPVVHVGTDINNGFKQELYSNVGGFFQVIEGKVVPTIKCGDIIKVSYKKEVLDRGSRRFKIVRLLDKS